MRGQRLAKGESWEGKGHEFFAGAWQNMVQHDAAPGRWCEVGQRSRLGIIPKINFPVCLYCAFTLIVLILFINFKN